MELEMYAYKRYASVAKYRGNNKHVVIPQKYKGVPVTEIRDGVFRGSDVVGVIIPSTIQTIGANAFADCPNLRYVGCAVSDEILKKLRESCDPRESGDDVASVFFVMPPGLRTVETEAFKGTAIKKMCFLSEAVEFGDSVFEGCPAIETVDFPNCSSLSLGKRVFANSAIRRFLAPRARIDTMPESTFENCINLICVELYISAVGKRSFYNCIHLRKLNTPKRLRSIGSEAFSGCMGLEGLGKTAPKETVQLTIPESKHVLCKSNAWKIDPELQRKRLALLWTLYKIEDLAKEAEKMDNFSWNMESTEVGFGDPLFNMSIEYRGSPHRGLPSRIKGIWGRDGNTYHFSIQSPSVLTSVGMSTVMGAKLITVMPIMRYMVKKSMAVVLLGKQNGSTYSVYEILPAQPGEGNSGMSLDFFHEVIERIKKPIPATVDLGTMMPPFTMHSEEEYETFIEICGSRLPAWVLNAYQKNKRIANRPGFMSSSEDKRHARRAQELLMNIDWLPHTVNIPTVEESRNILDKSFFGLDEVKIRVEEVVAQIRRTGTLPKWGILLHGPAGTGKTSIAKAIAHMLKMGIIQMDMSSLGDDPDEISGSSRIYTNARAGMLLESMFSIRSSSAVLLANEIDKAADGKGGRSAADILLTILDKTGFYENFLEEVVPTDNLFCIGTCNDLEKISKPLRDRFLVIDIPGYSPAEKKVIFSDYVFPIAMEKANISASQLHVDDDAIDLLVSEYAVEPGARDLEQYAERFVGDYCRHADDNMAHAKRTYSVEDVKELFGPGRAVVRSFAINPGEVNAAFYHDGKAHFFLIEASVTPGSGKFEVLGPIGKIQEEYCKVAYWCVRNTTNAAACDLSKHDVTVFVPQPIPEGTDNHVGLACYAAICSKILNRNLAIKDICFVGGCDLNGSLYFDENNLTPLLRAMKNRGVSTLYAPIGTNRLVDAKVNCDCQVTVIEGIDATTLFSLAVTRNNHRN